MAHAWSMNAGMNPIDIEYEMTIVQSDNTIGPHLLLVNRKNGVHIRLTFNAMEQAALRNFFTQ